MTRKATIAYVDLFFTEVPFQFSLLSHTYHCLQKINRRRKTTQGCLPDEPILLPLLDKDNTFSESQAAMTHDRITAETHKQQYSSVLNKPNQAYAKILDAP